MDLRSVAAMSHLVAVEHERWATSQVLNQLALQRQVAGHSRPRSPRELVVPLCPERAEHRVHAGLIELHLPRRSPTDQAGVSEAVSIPGREHTVAFVPHVHPVARYPRSSEVDLGSHHVGLHPLRGVGTRGNRWRRRQADGNRKSQCECPSHVVLLLVEQTPHPPVSAPSV